MSVAHKITYTNRTEGRLILTLEPWAEEYWIEPGDQVDIEVRGGVPGQNLEIEQTAKGLTFYGWTGSVLSVLRNGEEVDPSPQE